MITRRDRHNALAWSRAARRIRRCSTSSPPIKKFAFEVLKVDATPTFFINGEIRKGAMSFEELDATLKALLNN